MRKIKSLPVIDSHWLILLMTLYFGTILNISFWKYVFGVVEFSSFEVGFFVFSLIFFIGVPLYIVLNIVVAPYIGKPLIILFLLISSGTNYMMYNYGIMIDSNMIQNTFETNTREALDLMTPSCMLWIFVSGVLPAIVVAFVRIEYASFGKELRKRLSLVLVSVLITGALAAFLYKNYASFGRNHRNVRKLMNTTNYVYSTIRYFQRMVQANREFVILDDGAEIAPFDDPHLTVLVVVLGETARAKNFSLYGYERETNPELKKQDIIYFHEMSSCGTATAVSVPCIFSHQTRADFDVEDAKYTQNLMDILFDAGYDVWWRENDDSCKGVCKRVETEEMVKSKHPKYCKGSYCYDEVLINGLEERIKNVKKDLVIVLHTMGSHGPTYYNRYPDEFKRFKPTCDTGDIQSCSVEEIINTYDNTILYTDHVVSSAIDILKKYPNIEAGLVYVSDHGESLGENNMFLHGFPYKMAPDEQKEVPMILWMSETMKKFDYVDYNCMREEAKQKVYSHDNLFHSILGLLEVRSSLYNREYDIFKNCRTKELPF